MLKTLKLPSAEEFDASMNKAQEWAASVGYEESDVSEIIKSVRGKSENENIQIVNAKEFCERYFTCFVQIN